MVKQQSVFAQGIVEASKPAVPAVTSTYGDLSYWPSFPEAGEDRDDKDTNGIIGAGSE